MRAAVSPNEPMDPGVEPERSGHDGPDSCLARLADLGIAVNVHHHPAVFTVAESADVKAGLPGGHAKNLFLKDRRGRLILVTAEHATVIDLPRLGKMLGASGRLSFGSADLLRAVLGVEPGSVTPLAAINDRDGRVEVVLEASLMRHAVLNVHPLVNTMTVAMAAGDLLRALQAFGHPPRILVLPAPAGRAEEAAGPPP